MFNQSSTLMFFLISYSCSQKDLYPIALFFNLSTAYFISVMSTLLPILCLNSSTKASLNKLLGPIIKSINCYKWLLRIWIYNSFIIISAAADKSSNLGFDFTFNIFFKFNPFPTNHKTSVITNTK